MWRVPDLSCRVIEPERMDDPALDPAEHLRALRGLARLNAAGGAARILWPAIRDLAATPGHGPVSILDVATGSADVPCAIAAKSKRIGAHLDIHACDVSEQALRHAGKTCARRSAAVETFILDAVNQELPGEYDIVMSSLFLHHLQNDQIVDLLYRMRSAARRLVLISDLNRSPSNYRLAVAAAHLLSRSRVVHEDAAKSMRAALTVPEIEDLAARAGLGGAEVEARWLCRWLLTWSRER